MDTQIVNEHPILFRPEMVRAILAGHKTQTRRVIKFKHWSELPVHSMVEHFMPYNDSPKNWCCWSADHIVDTPISARAAIYVESGIMCPYGFVGDRLWVKETFQVAEPSGSVEDEWIGDDLTEVDGRLPKEKPENLGSWWNVYYSADDPELCNWWRPSIYMPRWASRINLLIDMIRVERLQDISELECEAEIGVEHHALENDALPAFKILWDSINAKLGHGWETNPWVWQIIFHRIEESHG